MKDNHWNIKLPNGDFARIPKPRELAIFATGIERIFGILGNTRPGCFLYVCRLC